ncbi:HNH endonuclease [Ruminococcus turbiniformis]|nr:HNH endonuclease [Ruminococcus turbiniformis]
MRPVRSVALTGWWNGTGEDVGIMPRRPNTPCKHPGCGRLVPYGIMYCEEHKPLHQHDRKTTSEKGYGSRWQKARAVYLQSHPLCARCLAKGRYVKATVVDHIIPHRGDRKLFWDRDNWQALCKSCHDSKTMTEDRYEEFRYPEGRSKSL